MINPVPFLKRKFNFVDRLPLTTMNYTSLNVIRLELFIKKKYRECIYIICERVKEIEVI